MREKAMSAIKITQNFFIQKLETSWIQSPTCRGFFIFFIQATIKICKLHKHLVVILFSSKKLICDTITQHFKAKTFSSNTRFMPKLEILIPLSEPVKIEYLNRQSQKFSSQSKKATEYGKRMAE